MPVSLAVGRTKIKMIYKISVFLLIILFSAVAYAGEITKKKAIETAEVFILQNGYTDAPFDKIKDNLDFESIEFHRNREDMLKFRFNTLKRKAIGVKRVQKGDRTRWSVAFDYVEEDTPDICRVVTMNPDGSGIRVEHVDGIRSYFVGFDID